MKRPRDMTSRQFAEACKRNGFKLEVFWLVDERASNRTGYGVIVRRNGKLMRRASLAKALRLRAEDERRTRELKDMQRRIDPPAQVCAP